MPVTEKKYPDGSQISDEGNYSKEKGGMSIISIKGHPGVYRGKNIFSRSILTLGLLPRKESYQVIRRK